jgi:hypothetical protein
MFCWKGAAASVRGEVAPASVRGEDAPASVRGEAGGLEQIDAGREVVRRIRLTS